MATNDKSTGLLSKMVQFMLPPTEEGVDSEQSQQSESGPSSQFDRQALIDRIERKRSDDAIRRREFDQLRKLRNSGPLVGSFPTARPSDFAGPTDYNQLDRASTIKKIDDIEANMSKHWLDRKPSKSGSFRSPASKPVDSKPAAFSSSSPVAPSPVASKLAPSSAAPKLAQFAAPPVLTRKVQPTVQADLLSADETDYDFTKTHLATPAKPKIKPQLDEVPTQKMGLDMPRSHHPSDNLVSEFSSSKLESFEMGDNLENAELQDAAIRFAEGDDVGAEAVLKTMLEMAEQPHTTSDACAAALFDMYRSTHQQARFEAAAIDYAQRFGRSPPEWYSATAGANVSASQASSPPPAELHSVWDCPVLLDLPSLRHLRATLPKIKAPWHLNWSHLGDIAPDAATELAQLLAQWCASPVQLHFVGVLALEKTLQSLTPAGDAQADQTWWKIRLDLLRIVNQPEEFDAVAMDFCVVYEVSPPSWALAKCQLQDGGAGLPAFETTMPPQAADYASAEADAVVVDLSGALVGDADPALQSLLLRPISSDRLVVSCKQLVRVDFAAAGALLNWVTECELHGCRVQFTEVPRLVAGFFTVIGITEYAKISLRHK